MSAPAKKKKTAQEVAAQTAAVYGLRRPSFDEERPLDAHRIQDVQQDCQTQFRGGEPWFGPLSAVHGPGRGTPCDGDVHIAVQVHGENQFATHFLRVVDETLLMSMPSMSMGAYFLAVSMARLSLASLSA